jgi:hypothetical protein
MHGRYVVDMSGNVKRKDHLEELGNKKNDIKMVL